MRITLNILQNNTCAQIYAFSTSDEDNFILDNNTISAVKIWHNHQQQAINFYFLPPQHYDNDYRITFQSAVSFKWFCQQFLVSDYNDPKHYSYLQHNCANAANFALQLAAINLPIGFIHLTSITANSFIKLPSPFLTPRDLYQVAKAYKIEDITQKPFVSFKVELASSSLIFWANSERNRSLTNKAMAVLDKTTGMMKTRPHHTECYLEVLIQTIDLLMRSHAGVSNSGYVKLAIQFRDRAIWPSTRGMHYHNILAHGFLVLGGFLDINHYSSNWWVISSFSLLTLGSFIPMIKGARQEAAYRHDRNKALDTELSQAMTCFSNAVVEMTFNDAINRAGCQ